MAENFLRLEMSSRPENVGACRLLAAHFAASLGFSLAEIEELKVAVSEAVSNAVIHGYPGKDGVIRFALEVLEGGLSVEIEDKGVGMADVQQARKASFSSDPERMGLGFVFMESFTDALEVVSQPGQGTLVRMVKMKEEARAEEAR